MSEYQYNKVTPEMIEKFKEIAPKRVLVGDEINEDFTHDEMAIYGKAKPEVLVEATSTEEVAAVVKLCNENKVPVTPSGARTGLVGGAVSIGGGVMISLTKMNKILGYDKENFVVKIQSGVLLNDLAQDAEKQGLLYPPDPGEKFATVGGNVATNAGGMRAVKYGCTRDYVRAMTVVLPTGEIVKLTRDGLHFYNIDEEELEKEATHIDWDMNAAEKGGYEHFMLKEMHEQPKAVKDTLTPRIKNGDVVIEELGMTDEEIRAIRKIFIVACGSAYHTGVTAKYVFEKLARIPVEVDLASEFRYRDPILQENTLVVIVSQSGETADTLAALRLAKEKGVRTLGIVNVVGSSIAREADNVMYTWAGPEIAVATTKAYSTQLIAQYLLAMKFAKVRGTVSQNDFDAMIQSLERLPEQISLLLSHKENVQRFANRYLAAEHVFFIGRGIDYAISMEGSLKLKEISYIHSEAYAAGELKHGTISLIEDGRLVVAVLTQPELYKKTISNIQEVKTRGAFVMAVTTVGNTEVEKVADYVVYLPETNPIFANSLAIIPLQLFGYYVSIGRGLDVDKPRNLAKSVTVE